MRRGRVFFYLAFIVILGLVAVVVVYQRLNLVPAQQTTLESPTPVVDLVDVVVVTQKISRGALLEEAVLGTIQIPRDLFIQGMFSSPDQVFGRQAKFDLDSGIPLTEGMLIGPNEVISSDGSYAALLVPPGMVAVSIPVNRLSSVSYAPESGDHVNVIVTMLFADLDSEFQSLLPNRTSGVIAPGTGILSGQASQTSAGATGLSDQGEAQGQAQLEVESSSIVAITGGGEAPQGRAELDNILGQTFYVVPSERQRPRMVSQALLQDAVVLKMGDFDLPGAVVTLATDQEVVPVEGQEQAELVPPTPISPDVVTLIVSPQDAITLNYLIYSGAQLTLALRSAGDSSRVETEAVTLQFLLDQYNIPVPVKLPYGLEPRIDELIAPELPNDIVPTPVP
jgi:Flp pilus assembly protein CpaB